MKPTWSRMLKQIKPTWKYDPLTKVYTLCLGTEVIGVQYKTDGKWHGKYKHTLEIINSSFKEVREAIAAACAFDTELLVLES